MNIYSCLQQTFSSSNLEIHYSIFWCVNINSYLINYNLKKKKREKSTNQIQLIFKPINVFKLDFISKQHKYVIRFIILKFFWREEQTLQQQKSTQTKKVRSAGITTQFSGARIVFYKYRINVCNSNRTCKYVFLLCRTSKSF